MATDFRDTWLWRRAFVEPHHDCSADEQVFFRHTFENMRDRVAPLVARIFTGGVDTASRYQGHMLIDKAALQRWAHEQATLLENSDVSLHQKAMNAEIILECGGTFENLPIARYADKWLTRQRLREVIKDNDEIAVHVGEVDHDDSDPIGRDIFRMDFKPSGDLLFFPKPDGTFVHQPPQNDRPSFLLVEFKNLLTEVWGGFDQYDDDEYVVGTAYNEDIIRWITVYTRKID